MARRYFFRFTTNSQAPKVKQSRFRLASSLLAIKLLLANLQLSAQAEELEQFADIRRHMRHNHQEALGNAPPPLMNNLATISAVNLNQ